jgi:broad specificity phosphatase PhoE
VVRYLLVRHAPAQSDEPDAPLTPQGFAEARALSSRLAESCIDAVWSSDMTRAVQTAEAVLSGRQGLTLLQSPLLREVEHPPSMLALVADPEGYAAWDRRVTAGLAERLCSWLRVSGTAAAQLPPNPTILVVSHGGPLRVLISLMLGLPPEAHWSFRVDHGSISELERGEDMGTLLQLNDCCHLRGRGDAETRRRGDTERYEQDGHDRR